MVLSIPVKNQPIIRINNNKDKKSADVSEWILLCTLLVDFCMWGLSNNIGIYHCWWIHTVHLLHAGFIYPVNQSIVWNNNNNNNNVQLLLLCENLLCALPLLNFFSRLCSFRLHNDIILILYITGGSNPCARLYWFCSKLLLSRILWNNITITNNCYFVRIICCALHVNFYRR
jgi:hypothetical protein